MKNIAILCPCYNEEAIIEEFLQLLTNELIQLSTYSFRVIMVDDGSTDLTAQIVEKFVVKSPDIQIELFQVGSNQGHQKAIYKGLEHIIGLDRIERVIVMDSDGEDDPKTIKDMLQEEKAQVIQITRGKRKEGILFQLGYFFYKKLTSIIIGKKINYGNYSMIDMKTARTIVDSGFIHYAAHLSKYRGITIKSDRMKRLGGQPKMNFDKLIIHGLMSLAEYSERLILFLLKVVFCLSLVIIILLGIVLYLKIINQATPGWASNLMASLFNSLLISFGFLLMGLILIKNQLNN